MNVEGPDSKYVMQWKGAWRPVMNMFDAQNFPTTVAVRAVKAVLYVRDGYWVATLVNPGEIVVRRDRNPDARKWDYIN